MSLGENADSADPQPLLGTPQPLSSSHFQPFSHSEAPTSGFIRRLPGLFASIVEAVPLNRHSYQVKEKKKRGVRGGGDKRGKLA